MVLDARDGDGIGCSPDSMTDEAVGVFDRVVRVHDAADFRHEDHGGGEAADAAKGDAHVGAAGLVSGAVDVAVGIGDGFLTSVGIAGIDGPVRRSPSFPTSSASLAGRGYCPF